MKFKIWRVTFLNKFLTIKRYWNGLPVFAQQMIYHVRSEVRQSLVFLINNEDIWLVYT